MRASRAASTGDTARMNSTRATLVWFSAAMKELEATATQSATAIPASPTERNACTTRPRSTIATYTSRATPAKAARPATCVAVSSVSWRCSTPAEDQATAASATYTCPRRWRRDLSSATVAVVTRQVIANAGLLAWSRIVHPNAGPPLKSSSFALHIGMRVTRDNARAMMHENVEIVRRFLVLDDLDEALTYADPAIVWNPVEESSAQGHDAVRASTRRWKREWSDYELVPEEFANMGDRVVVTVRFRARGRGSGIEVDARLYDVFTLRDGRIVRMDQFAERSEALQAAAYRA
jgi:ketosteroid isomerase-like protein